MIAVEPGKAEVIKTIQLQQTDSKNAPGAKRGKMRVRQGVGPDWLTKTACALWLVRVQVKLHALYSADICGWVSCLHCGIARFVSRKRITLI